MISSVTDPTCATFREGSVAHFVQQGAEADLLSPLALQRVPPHHTLLVRVGPLRVMPPFSPVASLVTGLITAASIRQKAFLKRRLELAESL